MCSHYASLGMFQRHEAGLVVAGSYIKSRRHSAVRANSGRGIMAKRAAVIFAFVVLVAASCGVIPGTSSGPKIGVVTDIGQLEDKSFNEYSWKGAQDGAKAIGAPAPQVIVTKDTADYAANIQQFIDQKNDLIATIGVLIATDTLNKTQTHPTIK